MKVYIFELNKYHTEVFPMYEHLLPSFLKNTNLEIHYFVLPEKLKSIKLRFEQTNQVTNYCLFKFLKILGLHKWLLKKKVRKIVYENKPDVIVFNSVEPNHNLKMFKTVDSKVKIGIVHNPINLNLIREDNEFLFVLSDIVYNKYKDISPISGYMLPYFQKKNNSLKEKSDFKTISIQGLVKFHRRNYMIAVAIAEKMKKEKVYDLKFNIVGKMNKKDGKNLKQMVLNKGLGDYFIFHDKLSDKQFFSEIEKSDYIMTALTTEYKKYYEDKTTASLSHSAAYKIPMILTEENSKAWDFNEGTFVKYRNANDFYANLNLINHDEISFNYKKYILKKIESNKILLTNIAI